MASSPPAEAASHVIWQIASSLATVAVELALVGGATLAAWGLASSVIGRVAALRHHPEDSARALQARSRVIVVMAGVALAILVVGYNGWLVFRGIDGRSHTLGLLGGIGAGVWIDLAIALGKLAMAAVGVVIALRIFRLALIRWGEAWLNRGISCGPMT